MITNRAAYIATYWFLGMECERSKSDDICSIATCMGPGINGQNGDPAMPEDWDFLNRSSRMTIEEAYAAALSWLSLTANFWHSDDLRELVIKMSNSRDEKNSDMWVIWSKALDSATEGKPVRWFLANKDVQDVFWKPNQDGTVTLTTVTEGVKQCSRTVSGPW